MVQMEKNMVSVPKSMFISSGTANIPLQHDGVKQGVNIHLESIYRQT